MKVMQQILTTNAGEEKSIMIEGPIVKLGIQTTGKETDFIINGNEQPIRVGLYGIYELDLIGLGSLSSIEVTNHVEETLVPQEKASEEEETIYDTEEIGVTTIIDYITMKEGDEN